EREREPDLAGERARGIVRHGIDVVVEEDPDRDHLHEDDRRREDRERAAEQRFRKVAAEPLHRASIRQQEVALAARGLEIASIARSPPSAPVSAASASRDIGAPAFRAKAPSKRASVSVSFTRSSPRNSTSRSRRNRNAPSLSSSPPAVGAGRAARRSSAFKR